MSAPLPVLSREGEQVGTAQHVRAVEQARALASEYQKNGVVCLRQGLDVEQMSTIAEAYDYGVAHPSPAAKLFYPDSGTTFYQDAANVANWPVYVEAIRRTPIPELVAALWGVDDVWFNYEQLFLKEGGAGRRTPWHQDSSYLPLAGDQLADVWITLGPLPKEYCLEFVRGSHRGPTYNASKFDPADDTAGLYEDGAFEPLPDIESEREKWDIVSWDVEPGDLLIFHLGVLHGGAGTRPGLRRRSIALRFFGPDVVFVPRPAPSEGVHGDAAAPNAEESPETLATAFTTFQPGDPIRHPLFPKVWPPEP